MIKELNCKDISKLVSQGKCLKIEDGRVYEIKKGQSKVSRIKEFFSRKKQADRYLFGFRGVSVACSPITLIQAYEKEPITEEERVELVKLADKKDNKFFIDLLSTHSEIGLEIMEDSLSIHRTMAIYRQWLIESQQFVTVDQCERLTDIQLARSHKAIEIVANAFEKAKRMECIPWIVDEQPQKTGYYQCTVIDRVNCTPVVRTLSFSKNLGLWRWIDGEKADVIAWKEDKPYTKKVTCIGTRS